MPSIKPALQPLQTPRTMVFPSELQSDSGSTLSAGTGRSDEPLSTPITPPVAYTEFLKKFKPILSPVTGEPDFTKLSILKEKEASAASTSTSSTPNPTSSPTSNPTSNPTSQPASAGSATSKPNEVQVPRPVVTLPPPTPYTAPPVRRDPRSLRALRIPPPPRYSSTLETPRSATTIFSPYSASPYSASPYSAAPYSASVYSASAYPASPYSASPYSATPSDWRLRYWEGPHSAAPSGRFSVRHVITHTVTFKRTQLEDPPKGKRRKREASKEP
ncbi:hypothetical protein BDV25DRAFT_71394 [Aspergillus avenaceus]|uniref:Uncharacterized protein n=1 Tax=Aspergillus avenaceus TaxID=36643 RepID=A0A5N6TGH2_ASPAV|nr:hypothetical protein BDV25DRAFT_71394 [Aspergillus avenaceus]